MQTPGGRRYRIHGLLGKGGFGVVYRATLQGDHGFERDVAIKLLHPDVTDPTTLARFRDEARILGLVRDRAVVAVDPPTRLDGRWALIMELVDGIPVSRLVKRLGVLPLRCALEIVQEVARVLDAVYRQPGPDGQPLALLHRDLKPSNLQLTPTGAVKVLDFGIARAHFDAREAQTSTHIVGTFKYMAPERMVGEEGPAGDIYSLGTVLRQIALGHEPVSPGIIRGGEAPAGIDPELARDVAALGRQMTATEPGDRPRARDVESRLQDLAARCTGPRLRDWAEAVVPRDPPAREDALAGTWLTETVEIAVGDAPASPPRPRGPRTALWLGGGAALALAMLVAGAFALGLASALLTRPDPPPFSASSAPEPTPPPSETRSPAPEGHPRSPATQPPPAPVPAEPRPERTPPAGGDPAAGSTEGIPRDEPVPAGPPATEPPRVTDPRVPTVAAPVPEPAPAPPPETRDEPAVADAPPRETVPLTFGSLPPGAEVFVNGDLLGRTPLVRTPVPVGRHTVTLRHPDREMIRSIEVGPDRPVRYVWNGTEWQAFQ